MAALFKLRHYLFLDSGMQLNLFESRAARDIALQTVAEHSGTFIEEALAIIQKLPDSLEWHWGRHSPYLRKRKRHAPPSERMGRINQHRCKARAAYPDGEICANAGEIVSRSRYSSLPEKASIVPAP